MADAVATQTIHEGPRNVIMRFTNISDGTGEAAVVKVAMASLTAQSGFPKPAHVRVKRIIFATQGMGVRLLWNASTPVMFYECPANYNDDLNLDIARSFLNTKAAGWDGGICFTTVGHAAAKSYNVELHMIKKYT